MRCLPPSVVRRAALLPSALTCPLTKQATVNKITIASPINVALISRDRSLIVCTASLNAYMMVEAFPTRNSRDQTCHYSIALSAQ